MENVVSAVEARTQLGQILKRTADSDERFLVDRRGEPAVIIMSVRDYIKTIAPTPKAYASVREAAKRKGKHSLSLAQITAEIKAVRKMKAETTKKTV